MGGINVFFEIGDSNAVGFGMSAATLPASLAGYDYGATFTFGEGASWWAAYAPGVNSGTPNNPGAFGPEAQFLRRVHDADPSAINLIISVQHGSTPLAQDAGRLDWWPGSTAEMFATAKATLAAARTAFVAANGFEMPAVTAVLWTAGWNDAFEKTKAGAYEANGSAFLDALRLEVLGQPDAPVIFSRMTDDDEVLPFNFDVRVGQWALDQADPYATSVRTIGLEMQPDRIHFSAAGYVELGDRFFEAWAI